MKKQRTITFVVGTIAITYGAFSIIFSQHKLSEIFIGLMMLIGGIGAMLIAWSMRSKEKHVKLQSQEIIKKRLRIIKKTAYIGAFLGPLVAGYGLLRSDYLFATALVITAISIIVTFSSVNLILCIVGKKLNANANEKK